MNRELKFRVWSKKENKWILEPRLNLALLNFPYQFSIADFDNVICQYTGVSDKNGEEIYEGDLLIFDREGQRDYPYTVIYSYGKFELKCPDMKMNIDIGYHREMIKIGNVFENSELLEKINKT